MHQAGFIHQDLKTDNFRVTQEGFVKILDFGISMEYIVNEEHKSEG
jgi:serine/threonine protein kinase